MADWSITAVEYAAYVSEWVEEYGIDFDKTVSNDEMTQEQYDMLTDLDNQQLVWTEHETCDGGYYTPGFKVMGDCALLDQEATGCGCWQSYAYHVGTIPWTDENEWIVTTATLPCEVCNPDGDGEGIEGCKGPDIFKGADGGDCQEGFVQWYFD